VGEKVISGKGERDRERMFALSAVGEGGGRASGKVRELC